MKITPILIGGFGNRLYQLSNALRLADKFNGDVVLPNLKISYQDVRRFNNLVIREADFSDFGGHKLTTIDGLPTKINEIFTGIKYNDEETTIDNLLNNSKIYYEETINTVDGNDDIALISYFFSYNKFIGDYANKLRGLLNPSIEKYIFEKYPDLLTKKIMGVHMRMGINTDNNPAIYVPDFFYHNIFNIEVNNHDEIYIFTDNPAKTENYIGRFNLNFDKVKVIREEPMYVDMLMMSLCHTLIVGCSTLSSFSSYINKYKNIYVPSLWLPHHGTNDIPKEWKVL